MNENDIRSALTIAQAKDIALQQGLAGTDREVMNILEQRCFRLEGKLQGVLDGVAPLVRAARSWHDFHHGSTIVQCDEICETLPAAEAAIQGRIVEISVPGTKNNG